MRHSRSLIALTVLAAACGGQRDQAPASDLGVNPAALQGFEPLPEAMTSAGNPITPAKIALGRMLYYDTRFSASGDVSCYVCHPLHDYGTSHRRTGVGHDGLLGPRNEPSVYNAAGHVAQFWDGRAPDVEAQALGPVLNPVEMGMGNAEQVTDVLARIPGYVEAFAAAYPGEVDPISFENFGKAIGAFERGLVTPSRWDAFLRGDASVLTPEEKAGFTAFVDVGCNQCHMGTYVGGAFYQKVGLVNPWYDTSDQGRFQVTENPSDRMVFKVPSLRNVEETWPYFHDGSVQRIDQAIQLMGWHQLGRELSDEQIQSIALWLKTLTGPVPLDYVNEPSLPPSPETAVRSGQMP